MSCSDESEIEVCLRCSDSEDLVVTSSTVDHVSHPTETSLSETDTQLNHDDSNTSRPSQFASQSARTHPEVKTKQKMKKESKPAGKEKVKRERVSWSKPSRVFTLISQYSFYKTQGEFDDVKMTNQAVWSKIAFAIQDVDFKPDWRHCDDKWRNLVKKYKATKVEQTKSGAGNEVEFPFYNAMDEVMGRRPHIIPPVTISSGDLELGGESNNPTHSCTTPTSGSETQVPTTKSPTMDSKTQHGVTELEDCGTSAEIVILPVPEEKLSTSTATGSRKTPPASKDTPTSSAGNRAVHKRKFDLLHKQSTDMNNKISKHMEESASLQKELVVQLAASNEIIKDFMGKIATVMTNSNAPFQPQNQPLIPTPQLPYNPYYHSPPMRYHQPSYGAVSHSPPFDAQQTSLTPSQSHSSSGFTGYTRSIFDETNLPPVFTQLDQSNADADESK